MHPLTRTCRCWWLRLLALLVAVSLWPAHPAARAAVSPGAGERQPAAEDRQPPSAPPALTAGGLNDRGIEHARAGRTGRAILAWERALRVDPRFEAAARNLERMRRERALSAPEPGLLYRYWGRWLPVERWAQLGLGLLGLFALLAWLRALPQGWRERLGLRPSPRLLALCLLALLGAGLGCWSHAQRWERAAVVVAHEGVALLRSPTAHAPEAGRVAEGEEVSILRRHGDFLEIATAAGTRGWIERGALERVAPRPQQDAVRG